MADQLQAILDAQTALENQETANEGQLASTLIPAFAAVASSLATLDTDLKAFIAKQQDPSVDPAEVSALATRITAFSAKQAAAAQGLAIAAQQLQANAADIAADDALVNPGSPAGSVSVPGASPAANQAGAAVSTPLPATGDGTSAVAAAVNPPATANQSAGSATAAGASGVTVIPAVTPNP
jgi:hypothetical protein